MIHTSSSSPHTRMKNSVTNIPANLGLLILDSVGLINDHVPPVELLEGGLLSEDHLIGGHHNIPLTRKNLLLDNTCLDGEDEQISK